MISYALRRDAAILQLCSPPVNAFSFAMLDCLRSRLAEAVADPQARGIVITGGPEWFSAGADLTIFDAIRSDADARQASRAFQEAFQCAEDSPKPVVAALAGNVLGGALELAMACHARVAVPTARFSLPEVNLDINPGAGGTQRLVRLVGLEHGLDMLLGGRPISAAQAETWGLLDRIAPADALLDVAAELAAKASCRRTSAESKHLADSDSVRSALDQAEQRAAKVRPELFAPREIVGCVRTGVERSFAAGLLAEQEAFGRCMTGKAARNRIYVFCASRQTSRLPELEGVSPQRIARTGVLGLGTMGAGIAQALLSAGVEVVACDSRPEAVEAGVRRIRDSIERRVAQGKLAPEKAQAALARLTAGTDDHRLSETQLVVEAVFEDVQVKREALARIEQICPAETIIASNTSTLDLDQLAAGLSRPQRLVGWHFFHPAQQMPLVEVVGHAATRTAVLASVLALSKSMGKTPVAVRNRPGFAVNRLFVPYLSEAFQLIEEGAAPQEVDAAMVAFGFAMGPLQLIDMSGLDILIKTQAILRQALPQHGPLSPIVGHLVDRGMLGQKSGAGVYRYEVGDWTPHANPEAEAVFAAARQGRSGGLADTEIVARLVLRMVVDAFAVLEERVVRRPADLDVAMILGAGLADFRGGILRHARDLGLKHVHSELERLARQCGPRYVAGPLLARAAADPQILNEHDLQEG